MLDTLQPPTEADTQRFLERTQHLRTMDGKRIQPMPWAVTPEALALKQKRTERAD